MLKQSPCHLQVHAGLSLFWWHGLSWPDVLFSVSGICQFYGRREAVDWTQEHFTHENIPRHSAQDETSATPPVFRRKVLRQWRHDDHSYRRTCAGYALGNVVVLVEVQPHSHYSDNQSPTSRSRQPSATISNQFPTKILVLNRSPTVCRPIADCLPTGRRVVDNQLPITRRLIIEYTSHFGTWSATIWRVIADWSPTVWRDVICIIFWITLPSKEIPTFLRPYVDSFMNTCWNFFWNEGDTIDYVNQLQQPVADQSPTNLELLFLYFSIICIFQDQMYIHFVWQPCLVVDGCWCCIKNLWPTKTARRSSTTICRPSKTTRKKGGYRRSARGCRCNSLTTSHRSSTNICRPPTTSGNHPKNSGC